MNRLHIDIESHSESDLKKEGVYRYAQHASTDLNVVCWAVGDGPVNVWMPWKKVPDKIFNALRPELDEGAELLMGEHIPKSLEEAMADNEIAAHNAQFERVVLNHAAGQKHGVPRIEIENTICTMAKCAVHGLPAALEHAANAFGTYPKMSGGANAMRYFAKPRKDGSRPTPYDEPDRFVLLVLYCVDDVKAERDLDNRLPELTKREQQVYFLDQRINERGVAIDVENVRNALSIVEQYKAKLAPMCRKVTSCNPSQTAKLADWCRSNGYPQLTNLQAPTVNEACKDPQCPDKVRKILRCYSTHNSKAVSKFEAMLRAVGDDGRLRGMFQFYGAGPGRWSSRIVQLQNLMRPVIDNADEVIEEMWLQDMDTIKAMHPDVDLMKVLASCTRGMLISSDDHDLMAYDFSSIESVIQAWLSDAEWKLDVFREGKQKIYNVTGAMMFGLKPEEIVDDGEHQLYTASKVGELACSFSGWEAAVEKMARQHGMTLTLPAAEIASRWREVNVEQVELWQHLSDAALWAVRNPGKAYAIPNKKIAFKVVDRWLCLRLPSGRKIFYLDPEIGTDHRGEDAVSYMGVDTYTRRWTRVTTYGGRILNNCCEGIGRDLLVSGMLNMEAAGYPVIATVHDEAVFEVDEGFGSDEEAVRLMTVPLKWAEGMPVRCKGWRAKRFRKD